jgi:aspartate/methionine/tyrosine aminotransferase
VRPVQVPFSQRLLREPGLDPAALIAEAITPRTAAIYMCTPNNPDGMVFDQGVLTAISHVAAERDLWVLADEVYEDFVYQGEHRSIGALPGMHERTITVFSFSKSHAMAGLRVGYAVGPRAAIAAVRKMANHSVYNVPQGLQRAAVAALDDGGAFLAEARAAYRRARAQAMAELEVPCLAPQGSTYLWLDLGPWCRREDVAAAEAAADPDPGSLDCRDRRADCFGLLEQLADAGVLLAPGAAFGAMYARWARLCFTSMDAARRAEGIDRLNRVLRSVDRR